MTVPRPSRLDQARKKSPVNFQVASLESGKTLGMGHEVGGGSPIREQRASNRPTQVGIHLGYVPLHAIDCDDRLSLNSVA